MQAQPTLFTIPTTSEQPTPVIVREYTSVRSFNRDARELYTRMGYTVSNTSGLAHRSYFRRILGFWGLHREHLQLVITYQAPTNTWQAKANLR
jgi:hypothetical protein